MSTLTHISVQQLRNLSDVSLDLSSKVNILYGQNGSGKSSFLEAVHYLGHGRSFRTRLIGRVIQHEQPQFTLHGKVQLGDNLIPIGLQKQRNGKTIIRAAGGDAASIITLAEMLPMQILFPDGHRLITGSPKHRRHFMDWGVFHVEHQFYSHWQRAERAIKQRNSVLKNSNPQQFIGIWNNELCSAAAFLDEARVRYIEQLTPVFHATLDILFPGHDIKLDYFRGWPHDVQLADALASHLHRDQQLGYTTIGPQRADIKITVDGIPAQDELSQGQQKIVVYALRLAQGKLLTEQTGKHCIYLIDDLPAELDSDKREALTTLLTDSQSQVFITGIEPEQLSSFAALRDTKMFHVEHGVIVER